MLGGDPVVTLEGAVSLSYNTLQNSTYSSFLSLIPPLLYNNFSHSYMPLAHFSTAVH